MKTWLRKYGLIICVVVSLAIFFGGWYESENVYAAQAVNIQRRITNKAVMQGVYRCYTGGMVNSSVKLEDYEGIGSLTSSGAGNDTSYVQLVSGGSQGPMGNLIGYGDVRYSVDSLSCEELFTGGSRGFGLGGSNVGLLDALNKKAPETKETEEVVGFFEDMGYVVDKNGGNNLCVHAVFKSNDREFKTANKICKGGDGKLYTEGGTNSGGTTVFSYISFDDTRVRNSNEVCLNYYDLSSRSSVQLPCKPLRGGKLDGTHLAQAIEDICGGKVCGGNGSSYRFTDAEGDYITTDSLKGYTARFPNSIPGAPSDVPGSAGGSVGAADVAIRYLSNNALSSGQVALSKAEKRILYQEYLLQYYGYEMNCADDQLDSLDGKIVWFDSASGKIKECNISSVGTKNKGNKVHGVDDLGYFGTDIDTDALISYLNSMTEDQYSEDDLAELGAVAGDLREEDVKDDCRNSGAGGTLGFFLCTVLDLAGTAVEGTYNDFIAPALAVNPQFFASSGVSDEQVPYQAWEQFRDIANVFFVVLLLVVLASQLTGLGIDNYGIKRILPKLIVSIVLINLSYLICVIAIDASNIIGNGAKALFDNLGNGLKDSITIEGNISGAVGAATTHGLIAVGLASGLATMVGPIWAASGPLVLMTLLPAVLGALVAVVFLFFLISARQAVVVVLVVLAPLAVACNILPNTKSVFDKYLKIFKVMLLVYPITSFLVAGGNYVSKLILQIGGGRDFYLALTSMVVGIVPIFFIPSMIKDAFAGLGKIGGTLSGFGKMASSRVSGAVKGNESFKAIQEKHANNMTRWRAGVDKNDTVLKIGGLGRFMRGGSTVMNANRSKYQSVRNAEMLQEELGDNDLFAKRLQSADEARALRASKEMYDGAKLDDLRNDSAHIDDWYNEPGGEQRAAALIESMIAQGGKKDVYNLLRRKTNLGQSNSVMNTLSGTNDAVLSAYGKKGRGMSYFQYMSGAGPESMAKYTERNDISGALDDDSMAELRRYSSLSQTISPSQVLEAATRNHDGKFLNEANQFLKQNAGALQGKVSARQLAGIEKSTIEALGGDVISGAFTDLAVNQNLAGGVDGDRIQAMVGKLTDSQITNIYSDDRIKNLENTNAFKKAVKDAGQSRGLNLP